MGFSNSISSLNHGLIFSFYLDKNTRFIILLRAWNLIGEKCVNITFKTTDLFKFRMLQDVLKYILNWLFNRMNLTIGQALTIRKKENSHNYAQLRLM